MDPGFPMGGGGRVDFVGGRGTNSQGGYILKNLYVEMKESGPLHPPIQIVWKQYLLGFLKKSKRLGLPNIFKLNNGSTTIAQISGISTHTSLLFFYPGTTDTVIHIFICSYFSRDLKHNSNIASIYGLFDL